MNTEQQVCSLAAEVEKPPSSAPLDASQVFQAYRAAIIRHLGRIVRPSEAEDLAQEVFIKMSRNLHAFQGRSNLSTWLFQIATRTALDHLRSRRFRQDTVTLSINSLDQSAPSGGTSHSLPMTLPAEEAHRQIMEKEMHGCVREFIDRLPADYREVLLLKDIEGLKNREISGRLGISLEATKIRLHRARKAMKNLLAEGCDFYRTENNDLACDRKASTGCSC